ncbi:MAG: hypothetical protein WEB50_15020 [Vicinamibacterales bacterium]
MRFVFLGLSLAGVAVGATAGPLDGLKIVTRETFPAGTMETTVYVAGDRVREQSRMFSPSSSDRHDGRAHVLIRRCDLNRILVLHPAERTYASHPLQARLSAVERFALSMGRRSHEPSATSSFVVETTTVDTGERRMAFGYSARRVLTTRRDIPSERSGTASETVIDGWYIDLETRPSCEQRSSGRARAVLVARATPADARRQAPRVTFKEIGTPEEGFAIETMSTWRTTGDETANRPASVVTHRLVTHVSRQPLAASLFEVPAGFGSLDGRFSTLAARWGRTAEIVRSVVASWFR